jgi:DNA-binding IclR family transcriptional regulator
LDSVSGVGVIDKGILILRALARAPLDLAALQDETGLPRATAHRLAVALELHGLVRRDRQGRFCLGFELIRLGQAAEDEFPLAEVSRPILNALRDATGESVQLYVADGSGRRCVVSLESTHGLRWIVPQGALFPLDRGSAGRVLQGDDIAESVEEREPGVASVSAAVRDRRGQTVAAVSLSGPVERLSRQPLQKFGRQIAETAQAVTAAVAR